MDVRGKELLQLFNKSKLRNYASRKRERKAYNKDTKKRKYIKRVSDYLVIPV